jgi:hypothetical protein
MPPNFQALNRFLVRLSMVFARCVAALSLASHETKKSPDMELHERR